MEVLGGVLAAGSEMGQGSLLAGAGNLLEPSLTSSSITLCLSFQRVYNLLAGHPTTSHWE